MFERDAGAARAHVPRRSKAQAWRYEIDRLMIPLASRAYPWAARIALFVVYFWFGFVKLIGLSEATGLARALTAQTLGLAHFEAIFRALAVFECVIGVLCLIPRAVRLVVVLVCIHMAMVCAPLLLVPKMTWQTDLVPTMDGQYIIKNVLIIAAVVGLAAHAVPIADMASSAPRREIEGFISTAEIVCPAPVAAV